MRFFPGIVTSLAQLAIVALLLSAFLALALLLPEGRRRVRGRLGRHPRIALGLAFAAAAIATSGSLYFSEVARLPPCVLCWYQRIAMYPLVPVLGIAWIRADAGVWRYALPLALAGLPISVYHLTIEWLPTLDAGICGVGVPCTARFFLLYGFISIPTMAGAAFLLIALLLVAGAYAGSEGRGESEDAG